MRENDPFGVARAARRVLDERSVVRREREGLGDLASPGELGDGVHSVQGADQSMEQGASAPCVLIGHEDARAGVAEDARLPTQMILDLRRSERRI